jgi:hypothetical protein
MSLTVNRCYIQPITSAGALVAAAPGADASLTGRGVYTLAAGTYHFPLPVGGSSMVDVHMSHDAAIAITSATIETCGHAVDEVSNHSALACDWADQDPSTAFVATKGAGTTATNGVVAVVAGNLGLADWQISGIAAPRARLTLVVATAGEVRVSFTGKD